MGAALKLHDPESKTKQKPLTLLSLIRSLRPMLPGKVVKASPTTYIVDGKAIVEFHYYCTWEERKASKTEKAALTKKTKECHPSYVKVYFNVEYFRQAFNRSNYDPSPSYIFRARIHNPDKSKAGFNLSRIATSVTECIEKVDSKVVEVKENEANRLAHEKAQGVEAAKLRKILPKTLKQHTRRDTYFETEADNANVTVDVDEETHKVTYRYECRGLTLEQLKTLIKAVPLF